MQTIKDQLILVLTDKEAAECVEVLHVLYEHLQRMLDYEGRMLSCYYEGPEFDEHTKNINRLVAQRARAWELLVAMSRGS